MQEFGRGGGGRGRGREKGGGAGLPGRGAAGGGGRAGRHFPSAGGRRLCGRIFPPAGARLPHGRAGRARPSARLPLGCAPGAGSLERVPRFPARRLPRVRVRRPGAGSGGGEPAAVLRPRRGFPRLGGRPRLEGFGGLSVIILQLEIIFPHEIIQNGHMPLQIRTFILPRHIAFLASSLTELRVHDQIKKFN